MSKPSRGTRTSTRRCPCPSRPEQDAGASPNPSLPPHGTRVRRQLPPSHAVTIADPQPARSRRGRPASLSAGSRWPAACGLGRGRAVLSPGAARGLVAPRKNTKVRCFPSHPGVFSCPPQTLSVLSPVSSAPHLHALHTPSRFLTQKVTCSAHPVHPGFFPLFRLHLGCFPHRAVLRVSHVPSV